MANQEHDGMDVEEIKKSLEKEIDGKTAADIGVIRDESQRELLKIKREYSLVRQKKLELEREIIGFKKQINDIEIRIITAKKTKEDYQPMRAERLSLESKVYSIRIEIKDLAITLSKAYQLMNEKEWEIEWLKGKFYTALHAGL